mgnify:CR=1 FL=1|jgi:hypothetical protein
MEEEREPLGKRIKRFFSLIGIVFAITAGIIVTQRLSNDAIALLIGLTAGVVVMIPLVALLIYILRRQEIRRREENRSAPRTQPQVVIVSPPAMPGNGSNQMALWNQARQNNWQMSRAEREFTIVGGET